MGMKLPSGYLASQWNRNLLVEKESFLSGREFSSGMGHFYGNGVS